MPAGPEHWFLDPAGGEHRRIVDGNRWQSKRKAITAIELARKFDEGFGSLSPRESITTLYWSDVMHLHLLDHWAVRTLLDAESIDGIVSIGDYGFWRDPGFTGAISSVAGSFRLRNKLFIAEADHRTPLSYLAADAVESREYVSAFKDPLDPVHQVRREWGQAFCVGGGAWYYALSGTGWSDPHYADFIGEARAVAQKLAKAPALDEHRPAVAVFADERAIDYMTQDDLFGLYVAQHAHNFARIPLSTSGLGYDPYLLEDLTHPDLPDYSVVVVLSGNTMTERQVASLEAMQHGGRSIVMVHAAGVSGELGLAETLQRTVGMDVRLDAETQTDYGYRAVGEDLLAEGIERRINATRGPVLHVEPSPGVTPLAAYDDGRIGAAVRRHGAWTGVYVAGPGQLTPSLLRRLAVASGVTPTGPLGDATYVGNGLVVLHAMRDGRKTLRFAEPVTLTDPVTGRVLASDARRHTFDLPIGETAWFFINR